MQPIYFSFKPCKNEPNSRLDASKLLGSPVFPKDFFEKYSFDEADYFVAQINLSELPKREGVPEKGWLYFFVNVDTLKPTVLFTEEEPEELYDDINDAFDEEAFGETTCHYLEFVEDGDSFLFGDNDPDLDLGTYIDDTDKVTLLQIDSLDVPEGSRILQIGNFSCNDGYFIFVIKEEDLAKRDFSKAELIDYGS